MVFYIIFLGCPYPLPYISWDSCVYIYNWFLSKSPNQLPFTKVILSPSKEKKKSRKKRQTMASTVITIPNEDDQISLGQKKKPQFAFVSFVSSLIAKQSKHDMRRVIHSIKVGIALVLVSLLYLLDPLYNQFGDGNAMWAIMTVVVIFEFSAGATLGKGLNRGIGTVLGGGLGCLTAILGDEVGGTGNATVVGISVFVFGAAATYTRMVPSIKRRYDYGAMIFILTFNLVAVSGVRADKVIELARQRLSTIGMGFTVCIFTNLLICPMWASDELHHSTASKFQKLASSIQGSMEEYFRVVNEKEKQPGANFADCKSVIHSKSSDESLANFARWEPWHGKFGFSYPWDKYLQIGDVLRDLAATIISLKGCLQSPRQPSSNPRQSIKEPCEAVGSLLVWILGELGESIIKMEKCRPKSLMASKLQSMRAELSLLASPSKLGAPENGEGLAMASFVFLLMEIVEKVEVLAKEVEELGELADFQTR
ncbi:hypothetical protein ACSBR2_021161 [Camellia fascicularis]